MGETNEVLLSEHEAIEELLGAIEGMAARMRNGAGVPTGDLEEAMWVVVGFADRCHHAKEERVLFPTLARASPPVGAEIARRLTSDHVAFRKLVGAIRELIPKARKDKASRNLLVKDLDTYARLLRQHIEAEHEQLFPEVERAIDPDAEARLAAEFERVEVEEIGAGMHDRFRATIRRFADLYAAWGRFNRDGNDKPDRPMGPR